MTIRKLTQYKAALLGIFFLKMILIFVYLILFNFLICFYLPWPLHIYNGFQFCVLMGFIVWEWVNLCFLFLILCSFLLFYSKVCVRIASFLIYSTLLFCLKSQFIFFLFCLFIFKDNLFFILYTNSSSLSHSFSLTPPTFFPPHPLFIEAKASQR